MFHSFQSASLAFHLLNLPLITDFYAIVNVVANFIFRRSPGGVYFYSTLSTPYTAFSLCSLAELVY